MRQVVNIEVRCDIALVMVENPPVNAKLQSVHKGLLEAMMRVSADKGISAVVLACEERTFIAGADTNEFSSPQLADSVSINEVIEAFENADKPW